MNRVNFVDKLIIKNYVHHEAHELGMKYFFGHPEYDYYIVWSDDVLGTPYHVKLLLEDEEQHGFPIVSGWCTLPGQFGYASAAVEPIDVTHGKIDFHFIPLRGVLLGRYGFPFIKKAWFNGLSSTLITRETLKKIPFRPYMKVKDGFCITPETQKNGRGVSFDIQFGLDCFKNQIPIVIDTRIFLLHARTTDLVKVGQEKPELKFVKATC